MGIEALNQKVKKDLNTELKQQSVSEVEEQKNSIKEIGGQKGPEPTRYGSEWEKNGRVSDF